MREIIENDIDKIGIFRDIKQDTKVKLVQHGKFRNVDKKSILFCEKENIDKIYFLVQGKVSIFKISETGERKIIFILNQGEMINEMLLSKNNTSTVGCEAFEKSVILEYNINDFINVLEDDFKLTKNILSYMERRTRRLYRQLKNSISIKMDKKLAAKLYRMSKEFGIKSGNWTEININISITYLADMLGCKRETLSRSIKALQDEGMVKIENKKIYVKQNELADYFKGT